MGVEWGGGGVGVEGGVGWSGGWRKVREEERGVGGERGEGGTCCCSSDTLTLLPSIYVCVYVYVRTCTCVCVWCTCVVYVCGVRVLEQLQRAAVDSVQKVSDALLTKVNTGVASVFANQKAIEGEAKALQTQSARLVKQTSQWVGAVDKFNAALKELGDVESWARAIEADLRDVAATLDYVNSASTASQ